MRGLDGWLPRVTALSSWYGQIGQLSLLWEPQIRQTQVSVAHNHMGQHEHPPSSESSSSSTPQPVSGSHHLLAEP